MLIWPHFITEDLSAPRRLHRPALEQVALPFIVTQQPPNPLLPSPRLPGELLNEIFEHLEDIEDDSERIEVGKQVSLVCRNWRIAGHRIVFAKVTLYCDGEDERAAKLLRHPHLIESIRELSVKFDAMSEEGDPVVTVPIFMPALAVVIQVIEGCSSNLETLIFDLIITDGAVLDRIARSPPARTLLTLVLMVEIGLGCSLFDVASALSRFVGLSILAMSVPWDGHSYLSGIPSMRTASLRLKALTLGGDFGRALAPLWDPSSLRGVNLSVTAANAQDLAWLSQLPQLEEVVLGTPSFDDFPAVCVPLIDVVKTLHQVELVRIEPDMAYPDIDDRDLKDSPIELDYVLDSIPPNAKNYFIRGIAFNDVVGLRYITEQDTVAGSPHVQVWVKGGLVGNVPTRVALVRKLRANGVQTWGILCYPESAEDDDDANSPAQSTASGADDERDDSHDSDTSI
ncbi:hypothetical protein JCM8208_003578 [Rhodotorula glutinis]